MTIVVSSDEWFYCPAYPSARINVNINFYSIKVDINEIVYEQLYRAARAGCAGAGTKKLCHGEHAQFHMVIFKLFANPNETTQRSSKDFYRLPLLRTSEKMCFIDILCPESIIFK